jgi:hypothetical protein
MNRLVLGNIDYKRHVTDEGEQLQAGLVEAGWGIEGYGYGESRTDVREILSARRPDVVFVQDPRDWGWRGDHSGCFNANVEFRSIEELADRKDIFKVTVCKDAGSRVDYQREFARAIGADAILVYYNTKAVTTVAPWLNEHELVRIYHSVDGEFIRKLPWNDDRKRGLVTGAVSAVYPLRQRVFAAAHEIGVDWMRHPGYGNQGTQTPEYLKILSQYKVHVATASRYHFALRKIIESVACGCTPITNLPAWDKLPAIDGALSRISDDASVEEIRVAVDAAEKAWDPAAAKFWAAKALNYYDWHSAGQRNSSWIEVVREFRDQAVASH